MSRLLLALGGFSLLLGAVVSCGDSDSDIAATVESAVATQLANQGLSSTPTPIPTRDFTNPTLTALESGEDPIELVKQRLAEFAFSADARSYLAQYLDAVEWSKSPVDDLFWDVSASRNRRKPVARPEWGLGIWFVSSSGQIIPKITDDEGSSAWVEFNLLVLSFGEELFVVFDVTTEKGQPQDVPATPTPVPATPTSVP